MFLKAQQKPSRDVEELIYTDIYIYIKLRELYQADPEIDRSWLLLTFRAKELFRLQLRMKLSPREGGESGQRLQGRWHLEAYRS